MDKYQLRQEMKEKSKEDKKYDEIMPLVIEYTHRFGIDDWIKNYIHTNTNRWANWKRRHGE